jgi:hypothetical protein
MDVRYQLSIFVHSSVATGTHNTAVFVDKDCLIKVDDAIVRDGWECVFSFDASSLQTYAPILLFRRVNPTGDAGPAAAEGGWHPPFGSDDKRYNFGHGSAAGPPYLRSGIQRKGDRKAEIGYKGPAPAPISRAAAFLARVSGGMSTSEFLMLKSREIALQRTVFGPDEDVPASLPAELANARRAAVSAKARREMFSPPGVPEAVIDALREDADRCFVFVRGDTAKCVLIEAARLGAVKSVNVLIEGGALIDREVLGIALASGHVATFATCCRHGERVLNSCRMELAYEAIALSMPEIVSWLALPCRIVQRKALVEYAFERQSFDCVLALLE